MTYKTFPGKVYTVTTPNGCTVYDSEMRVLVKVLADSQQVFVATTDSVTVTDEAALVTSTFHNAPVGFIGTGGAMNGLSDLMYSSGQPSSLQGSHVYDLGELTQAVDLSTLAFEPMNSTVQTAELWLSIGSTAYTVTWPTGAVWVDGEPELEAVHAYRFAVRQEPNGNLVINLAYELAV